MVTISRPRGARKPKEAATSGATTADGFPGTAPTTSGGVGTGTAIKLQRSPMKIAVSLLAIVLAALGAAWLATTYRDTTDVVSVRQDVSRGAVIERDDLQTASITLDPALRTVPKADLESLVGKRAVSDLSAGTIVAPSQVASDVFPPKNASVVGLYLSNAQMPTTTLRPSSVVRIVATPKVGDEAPAAGTTPVSYSASVIAVKQQSDGSHAIVDVLVPKDQAAAIATLQATQRIALVLDGE